MCSQSESQYFVLFLRSFSAHVTRDDRVERQRSERVCVTGLCRDWLQMSVSALTGDRPAPRRPTPAQAPRARVHQNKTSHELIKSIPSTSAPLAPSLASTHGRVRAPAQTSGRGGCTSPVFRGCTARAAARSSERERMPPRCSARRARRCGTPAAPRRRRAGPRKVG